MDGRKACSNQTNSCRLPTEVEGTASRTLGSKDTAINSFSTRRERVEPTASVGAESSPVVNENGISPEAHEDHASPPEEESVLQDNGKSPEVHDEAQPKGNPINSVKPSKGKSSVLNKEACSSDDDNDSSFDDSLMYKYGFTDSTLLEDYEDGVFGTLSNNPSASLSGHVNPKGKKNKKKPPGNKMVIGGAGKQLKR
nr:hypothetical protein Iba_chr08cCG7160 [Ipomoea batatas]